MAAARDDYAHQFNPPFRLDPTRAALVVVDMQYCVEGTARDATDRGYRCLLGEDGCGAASERLHEAACENFQRLLGRADSAVAVLRELGLA